MDTDNFITKGRCITESEMAKHYEVMSMLRTNNVTVVHRIQEENTNESS